MTGPALPNTLILKRQKGLINWFPIAIIFLFMTVIWLVSLWCISHPWHGYLDILICHWLMSIIYPFTCLAMFVQFFPGQGDLLLSP